MKTRKPVFLLPLLGCLLMVLSACFTPYTGEEVTVTIGVDNSENGRTLLPLNINGQPTETLSYEVILSSSSRTKQYSFEPGVPLTVKVFQGKYDITVRAMGASTMYSATAGFPSTILRALGEWSGDIRAGNKMIPVTMYSATEVTTWEQLDAALGGISLPRKEIIILKGGGPLTLGSVLIITRPIEIRAESPVTIYSSGSGIFQINGINGKLTLKGPLTLNGNAGSTVITVGGTDGELYIYDGVTITNGFSGTNAGGVIVNTGCKFYMYGGTIAGNITGSTGVGGGVLVMSGSEFTMSGGTITGNTAYNGGGVSASGLFTMLGNAEIYGNNAAMYGGGVYVTPPGIIRLAGGAIYGQGHPLANFASGGGHALTVLSGASATFGDGTIIPGGGNWNDTIYGKP